MRVSIKKAFCALIILSGVIASGAPVDAGDADPKAAMEERLGRGDVIVGLKNVGEVKYVTGTIQIDQPPDRVWAVVVNPYEFKGKITPRMKEVEMMVDHRDLSVMRVTMDIVFFPHLQYVVESKYQNNERIDFKRVAGTIRDFKGTWSMQPLNNGSKTELSYSMYLDPGFFVPQWLIREGVKSELPRTLASVRKRVIAISKAIERPEAQTIAAAYVEHHNIAGKDVTIQ